MAVMVKGQYDYGFTILPNVLRDELMPLAGTDAFAMAYMVMSWAGKGERGAAMSARYVKEKTRWSAGRMASAKADLLKAWPQVFSMTPGDAATSRPETWWVDFDALSELHGAYLKRQKEQQAQKRGPGRPKKPVPETDTGFSQGNEKPVPGINTGFFGFTVAGAENLFRKPEHPCSENRNTQRKASKHL